MSWEKDQTLWRLRDDVRSHSIYDDDGEWLASSGHSIDLIWEEWHVDKLTPRGAWILPGSPSMRARINVSAKKWVAFNTRFVSDSREAAIQKAVAKRAYHVRMCTYRLELAQKRLRALERCNDAG